MINRLLLLVILAVAACSPPTQESKFPTTPQGITAVISQQSQDFDWEVTDVANNIITASTFWNGERVIHRKLYRGLYPIYGMEFGKSFEVDFDYELLDQIFPLKPGNDVTFEGTLNLLEGNYQASTIVHIQVKDTGTLEIDGVSYPVHIIKISTQFSYGDVSDITHNTLYYSSELGLTLKSVTKAAGSPSYWRIKSIDVPKDAKPKRRRNNRAGTVMI